MQCPYCDSPDHRVIDTRESGNGIRRRRECRSCGERFTTYERIAHARAAVIKRDGSREPFAQEKLAASIRRAFAKGEVSEDQIQSMAEEIERQVQALGRPEVASGIIGRRVLERLREAGDLPYLRYASVHRRLRDADSLVEEIAEFRAWKEREEELENQLKLSI